MLGEGEGGRGGGGGHMLQQRVQQPETVCAESGERRPRQIISLLNTTCAHTCTCIVAQRYSYIIHVRLLFFFFLFLSCEYYTFRLNHMYMYVYQAKSVLFALQYKPVMHLFACGHCPDSWNRHTLLFYHLRWKQIAATESTYRTAVHTHTYMFKTLTIALLK